VVSKDTIDKLNRLEFFYWCKPIKTPEVLKQDKEQVEKDFALIRKELKALEILKNKKLNLFEFYLDFIEDNENYEYYQCHYARYHLEMLTQEEFDLLKEVLKDER